VVLKVATNHPSSSQSLWELGGANGWGANAYPNPDGSVFDDFGSTQDHNEGIPAQPLTPYHIYEVSSQTNNWSSWINGVMEYQSLSNAVSFSTGAELGVSTYNYYITGWTTFNSYFAGDVAEVLIFNRGLTSSERLTVNAYLNGKYSLVPAVPATPSNLVAMAISPTQVALTWDEPLNGGATQIGIERLVSGNSTYQLVAQVNMGTSYIDTNAAPGTMYYYRVRAINIAQWSGYSAEAQATTPATGSNLPFTALAMWLKADVGLWQGGTNTPVNLWQDASGNNNHATQWSVANQPTSVAGAIGDRPAVWFNGTNSFLNLPTIWNGVNAAEAFVVLKVTTNHPSSFQSLWELGGDGNDPEAYPNTDGSIADDFGSTTMQSLGIPAQPLTQYHVYEVSSQQDNWAAWINGNLLYQTSETGFNTISFAAGMQLGQAVYLVDDPLAEFVYQDNSYFAGQIAEVLAFNRALAPGERTAVNNYLNGKYGLGMPVVSITGPTNNALVPWPGNVPITATASDAAGISQVQFFQGSTSLGIVTNSPYSLVWSNPPLGGYILTAVAKDNNGLMFTSSVVNLTIDGILLTAPTNNSVQPAPANININASVGDGAAITRVQFFQGSNSLVIITNVPYSFIWSNVTSGTYALSAQASDSSGLTLTSGVVNVTVDNLSAVTLTNPISNARFVAGTNILLGASATDSDGTVTQVQFFQGTNNLGVVTSAPYSLIWSNVPAGALALTACAMDNSGLVFTSAVVNIMVAGISVTSPTNNVVLTAPASITVGAAVTDNVGINQVQFFQGTNSLGILTNSPYNLVWTNVVSGVYALSASAIDAGGLVFKSGPVSVIVDTNSLTTDRDGDGVSDYIEYLEGRNPLAGGAVPDTNGVVNLQIYTPLH